MKKITAIMAVLMFAMTTIASANEECSSVSGAKKLMGMNRTDDAIVCLDKLKTDAEANFLLGTIWFQKGSLNDAKERFSAPAVKNAYGKDIYPLYKKEGDAFAAQGNYDSAEMMYDEALAYKPEARQSIAEELFALGKTPPTKDGYFALATKLDKTMGPKIGSYLAGLANKAPNADERTNLICRASKADNQYGAVCLTSKEALGRGYLDQAKQYAKKIGEEENTAKFKTLARENFKGTPSEGIVDRELPEVMIFHPGTYNFLIKAGEKTPWKISFPSGKLSHYNISSADYNYQILFEEGPLIKDGPTVKYPANKYTFTFIAITDQNIQMVVTQE